MKRLLFLCALLTSSVVCHQAYSQRVGVKTNLLYDATATINLGFEFRLGDKTSLDVPVNWNSFTFSENRKWKHILVQPEFRLWTRETFSGHFFGLHGHYAFYNVGNLPRPFSDYMRDHRFEGWLAGVGISYGYRWDFSSRLGMEATVGVGYAYLDYEKFDCAPCGQNFGSDTKHYFGPTKVGLSLVYNIGRKRSSSPDPDYIPVLVPRAEPVFIAPYVPEFMISYIVPEAKVIKTNSESGKVYIDFAVGKSAVSHSFKDNAEALDNIYNQIETIMGNPESTITGVAITGYASPEGGYANNQVLSERRATALKNHLKGLYGLPEKQFSVKGKGEDWATLDSLVSESNISSKDAALGIIRGTEPFDRRDRQLMALSGGDPYRQMKSEMFPQLRRTEYWLSYIEPLTSEKGFKIFMYKPASLTLDEMYIIAKGSVPGSEDFCEVFETAARMFPQDDISNLNAAASTLGRGDVFQAERFLSKVKAHTAEYYNNLGILYGHRGEWDKAAESFRRAQEYGSVEARHNLAETLRKQENLDAIARSASR